MGGALAVGAAEIPGSSVLRQAIENGFLGLDGPFEGSDVGPLRFVLVGLLIMLLVIFRPQGMLGSRQELTLGD